MPRFGERSQRNLAQCDPRLRNILTEVIKMTDFAVIEGYRSYARQEEMFHAGKSKLRAGESKHNHRPSLAVDVAPWLPEHPQGPIPWEDPLPWHRLAGAILHCAHQRGIPLRWGGDWDGDGLSTDQRFNDLPHFELR